MSRRVLAAAVASVAAVLLAILAWFLWMNGADDSEDMDTASSETEASGAERLTLDGQTPKRVEEKPTASGPSEPSEASESVGDSAGANPYNFKTKEEAYDFFAELVGLEFDRLIAEGKPPSAVAARGIVYERVFMNNEMPQLREAMDPFLPEYTPDGTYIENSDRLSETWSDPARLLVHTGRLPETELYAKAALPNGKIRYLDDWTLLKVTYRVKMVLDEPNRQILKKHEQRKADLTDRYSSGGNLSESELAELDKLTRFVSLVHSATSSLSEPYEQEYINGRKGDPRMKESELDLGVIEQIADLDEIFKGFH